MQRGLRLSRTLIYHSFASLASRVRAGNQFDFITKFFIFWLPQCSSSSPPSAQNPVLLIHYKRLSKKHYSSFLTNFLRLVKRIHQFGLKRWGEVWFPDDHLTTAHKNVIRSDKQFLDQKSHWPGLFQVSTHIISTRQNLAFTTFTN